MILGFGIALGYHLEMSVVSNESVSPGWCLLLAFLEIFIHIYIQQVAFLEYFHSFCV